MAAILGTCVRKPDDCVARYGGEEFVIVLPETSAESARTIAGRIVLAVPELNIPHKSSPFGMVTVSIGIATVCPGPNSAPSKLLDLADVALYAAKEAGRNRIEVSVPSTTHKCVAKVPEVSYVA